MAESQLRTLYESLRRDNYDVPGTYESFERTLTAPGKEGVTNRQTLYNSLHADGYDVPDTYESFANTLFVPQPKQQAAPASQAVAEAPAPTQKTQAAGKATAPVQKAQPQVRAQTRPTSQQPTGTVAAFKLRRGGHDFYVTQQEVNEAGGLGAWAAKHPGAPVRVYMHGDGFTGHVDLSEASKRRKEKGYKYTLEYRPGHKVKRSTSGWVDNLVEYGQEAKAIEEMTAPTKQVVEQLWSAAEKKQTTDARNNYDALNNKWARTGDDMPFVDSSVRYLANETDRMKNFDLDKMSEEAWRRSGAALTQKVYQRLKLANPKTDDSKLIEQAEAEAWRLTNKAVYDYAVEKNMPKSVLEYFFKKVMDQNSVVSLLRGTARSMAGTTGDRGAYEAAQEEYGKKHKVADVAGTVVGMGADPMMTLTGGAGGAAGKAVLNVGGRLIARKAAGTAVETGTRLFANKLGAKVAAGVASGSVNLGMYEGLKEGERQFLHGGYINPETGQNEGYSLQAMFESAGKGAILGAATGVISPIFGNVGNKLVGKADRISSTGGSMAAKAGIRATQHLVATGLEGTIFATEGWLTTDEDKVDVWLDSMATMIGFKGHHIIKSAPRVIAGMRPVKPTADRPLTIDERNFNRKSFVERVSAMLDGPKFADERRNGSGMPLSFTKDDISTLKEAGYGSLADIFRSDRAKEADKPFEERVLDALGEDESTAEMSNGSGGLLDGYSEMEKLVKDASVPQEIRAKAYYALTGHCLGAGTITGHATRETDDGRIAVDALTNNGEIVYRRYYKSKDAANAATEKLDRQIELNKIDVGEQYADAVADETILDDVIKAQYPDNNPENIKKIYYGVKYGKARADEHLRKGIDAIDKEIEARKDEAADMRPDAIRKAYGEEYGVDIDDAIRKLSGDRSEAEKSAVESYIARLFASGETRVDRYDSKSDSYVSDVSDVADAADVAETQPETQPIGRATMKFQDGPVEVLSGRVVMTEDGKMVDVERSDKTIVVRDPATGKTEMVSPEAMLSYEDVAPEVAADERSMPKYSSGRIVIRDADGKERRGFLTGDVDDQGRYEYYLAGDLNHLFYATEEELDNRVTKFVPDRRNDVADVSDVADEKQNEVSVSMPTGVEAIGAVDVAQSDGYGRRFTVGRNENGELFVVDERGYMWAHDGNGERMEPYQPGANVPVWTEEQIDNLGDVQSKKDVSDVTDVSTRQSQLSSEEAADIINKMESSAVNDPQISLSPESWQQSFGLSNSIDTPLGKVKMGDGQYQKLIDKKRSAEFGMVVQTLQDPDVVFIEPSAAKEGQTTEREYSYVFVKTFIRDGKKFKYYTSVSVLRDGMEVSVSSHIASRTAIMKKLQGMERAYTKQSLLPNSSEWHLAEHPTDVPDLLPTQGKSDANVETADITIPERKGSDSVSDKQVSEAESSVSALERLPRDEKGEPIFEQAETPEIAWDALVEFSDGDVADAKEMADIVTEQKRKALEKLQKQKPKGASLAELRESQKVIKAAREQAEQEYNFWQQMAGVEQLRQAADDRRQAEERAEADRAEAEEKKRKAALDKRLRDTFEDVKDVPEAVEVLEDMDPRDIYEAAAQLLSGQKVLWSDAGVKVGARSETGFGEEERRRLFGLFASEANGGKSLSRLAEDAMKQQCETYGIPYDNQDARNALIDVISGARTVGDIRNYIANNRIDEARRLAEAKRRLEEEQYDEFCRQEYHLSAEEVEAYEDQFLAEFSERDIEFDANEYNDYIADEMARAAEITEQQKNGTEDNDTRRGSTPGDRRVQENDTEGKGTVPGRGYEVLPESRADQSNGAAADGDRSGIQPADGVQGDGPASAVAQGAQRGGIAAVGRRKADDSPYGGLAEEVTSAIGPFGKIYTQFRGKPREAVTFLLAKRDGEAIGALHHKDVGEIDLVWGEEGSAHSDGFGLAKLAKYHPEVLFNLQEILNDMAVTKRSANRVQLESEKYKAAVRLTWDNQKKTWLLTMFEKKNSALDNTTDTDKTHKGNGNDTATPENTVVSDRKDNDSASDKQASGEESLPQFSDNKRKSGLQAAVEAASAEVNTEPTEAQKKAGNYKKGHVTIGSFDITIENPAGSVRRGVDADGKEWSTTMANAYGEIRGTQSVDGDPIDVFLASDMDAWNGRKVFVVDQTNADGSFDEHKVMLGFNDKDDAMAAYLANYNETWADTHPGLRITEASLDDFQKWVESSHRKTKAFADYSMVKGTAEAVARRQKDEAGLRTERPERGANYDILKSDLVGFAKKFKGAGTANITAIEREMSEWMSKQTAEDIVDLDTWMLSDVCNEAGLDKGKAWAFRMSIDHSTPKELIEEVFKIRNRRRMAISKQGIAPRGANDVFGLERLEPESQKAVLGYLLKWGSAPICVVSDMKDILSLGLPQEVNAAFEDVIKAGSIPALFNRHDKKVYIFAELFNGFRQKTDALFHENIHGAIDEYRESTDVFLSSFHRKVIESGYEAELFRNLEAGLKEEYAEDSIDEEFLAYTLPWMVKKPEREKRIMELLSDEEREFINDNILNKIQDAQRRRKTESSTEEGKGHEFFHIEGRSIGNSDGARVPGQTAVGDERRGNQGVAGDESRSGVLGRRGGLGSEVYEAAKGLLEAAGVDVVEVSDTEAAEMLNRRGSDVPLMGSRTDRKMAKVAESFKGRELDENQQAVVDVFSGKRDNVAIEVERRDGKRRVVMRQGSELKAGTKHSLFRHYETSSNYIAAEDIALIPEVIAKGEREEDERGIVYNYTVPDSSRLKVTTSIKNGREEFTNLFSNRKPLTSESRRNTQLSARATNAEVSDAKVDEKSETGKPQLLRTSGGVVYGWTVDGKVYLNRDAMNPETPLHEYTHLWDDMVRRENPELWARGKELMKQTPLWQEVIEDPNYADIRDDEDSVASEVHSRLTGKDGARILSDMIEEVKKDGPLAVAERVTLVERLKRWLGEMFSSLKKTLSKWSNRDLDELTVEDFVRMTLRDLAEGISPNRELQRGDQMRMVTKENPMLDDYHTGIRTREDVKTFDEMLSDAESNFREYGSLSYPDMDIEMLREAKRTGEITVYSSKPIKAGLFVTPSRMNAEDYAGGEKVYSKKVSVEDIAWISEDEGQFAPVHVVADDEGLRFHAAMSRDRGEFDAMRERAVREHGIVMPGLNEAKIHVADVSDEAKTLPEAKRSHAEKLAKKFNTPITIVDDVEKLPAAMRNKKGGYDVRSGNVIVVIPNHADVEDVAETVFHEVVAHKGLREMLGEENYDAFCDEIYGHLKDDLKRQVDTEAGRRFMREPEKGYEHHRRVAVDELFGRMAEKGFEDFTKAERGIWAKLKAKVLEAINKFLGSLKLPKWVRLGDNELRYILWRSHERLGARAKAQEQVQNEALDFVDMARDVAKRAELGLNKSDVIVTRSRKRARIDKLRNSRPVEVTDEMIPRNVDLMSRKEVKTALKEVIRGTFVNEDNGNSISVFKDGINEVTSHGMTDLAHVKSLFAIPEMLRKSIYIDERKNEKRHTDFEKYQYYVCGLKIDGLDYTAKIVVGVRGENRYYDHRLTQIEKGKLIDNLNGLSNSETENKHSSDGSKGTTLESLLQVNESEIEYRFRESETGDIWKDQSIGLKEKITYAALRLSKAQADDLTLRNDAMAAIGDNLKNLLHDMRNRRGTTQRFAGADHKVEADIAKAKAAQLRYDRSTVKRVGDLARILMQTGYLSDMTSGEILRLMSAVKNSVGGNDIESSVDKIMDIMIGNQLRNAEDALHSLLSIRGSKVDSRGVEVQGELDIDGQRTIEVVKRTINLNEDDITSLMDDARDRMGDSDKIIADNAAIEYAGLNMALDYAQNIANSKAEETALRYDLKTANEDMKVGRLTENAYKQLVDSIDEAIRKNKIERAEAYFNLVGRLSDSLRESIENAKAFRNAEKARVREIHHNANSDMEGRPSNEHHKDDWKDRLANGFSSTVLAPLGTFDQILRTFGSKSVNGEGYLWNRFMRGWVDCRNKELLGVKNKFARLDEKVAEICDRYNTLAKARGDSKNIRKIKNMADMIKLDGKLPTATVKFWDGGEMCEHELTQGNLLYIYMVDKMTDGRMKLRRMGITEEDIANVEKALDPRFKEFGDWLQEEFLVETRNEYNETHKKMFGASMAAIENYFPLKILSNARADKEEDLDQLWQSDGITTKTGSIIKRRTNSLALDIMGSNALSVVLDHITEMEHWNAYVEWNRDLNALRTYKRFRNQVINMTTAYGGGEKLWKRFNDLCRMAAGRYRPPISELDKGAVNLAKGVTAAKVSFRIFTALKQFLSAPAYIPEVSVASISKSLLNPYGDFKWCMENLPIFYERWHSRISGDPRLLKGDGDWKMWRQGIAHNAARLGMTPNAFVDALTVSIGARAIYQTRLKRYLKEGYGQEEAENRAKQDATILFNQTQQSSESPFLSTMQADRTWINVLFTVFRNSSMSYTRQEYDALRNLKRNLTPGQRDKSIEFMTKQILRDWDIDPDTATDAERDQAQSAAKKRFRRQLKKDVVRLATFGFILPLAWNLGAYLPYIIFGDDEDEKDKMWDDALTHAYFGSVEGLTGGDVMSGFFNMWASGEWDDRQLTKDMPLASDISSIIRKFAGEKNTEAINDIINLAIQSGIGVNPQSITDVVVAITDACGDDPRLSHEAAICIMRILQVPQSQLDKMYFDEVGLSGREISQYTPGQLAQRYAEYKIMRGTPFVPWMWGDEEQQSKYEKSAQKKIKERLAGREDDEVVATYEDLDDRYKSFTKKIGAVKEMMGTDYIAAAQEAAELQNDPDFKIYQKRNALDAALDKAMRKWPPQRRERVKDLRLESTVAGVPQSKLAIKTSEQKKVSLTGELNRIANKYFTAETPEEARLIADTMAKYRALIVDAMQTNSESEQEAAISELSTLIHDFRTKEEEMRSTKR